MAQLMPLPLTVSCFSKIKIAFTFLVPAHLGSPEKGPLNVYVRASELVRVCVVDYSHIRCLWSWKDWLLNQWFWLTGFSSLLASLAVNYITRIR